MTICQECQTLTFGPTCGKCEMRALRAAQNQRCRDAENAPDNLRMWALVGWYVLICLAGAIGCAMWSWA